MKINVIMSAETAARTPAQDAENTRRTYALHGALYSLGVPFRPARGCYKGVEERSIVALVEKDSDDYETLLELAWHYGQESVLTVTADGVARLVFPDREERIGVFKQVNEQVARSCDGWTRVRADEDVTRPPDWWIVSRDEFPVPEFVELDSSLH